MGPLLQGLSHKATIKPSASAKVSSEGSIGEIFALKITWQLAEYNSRKIVGQRPPSITCPMGLSNMANKLRSLIARQEVKSFATNNESEISSSSSWLEASHFI